MEQQDKKSWGPIIIVFLAGSIATALVPLTIPILGPISKEFGIAGSHLGWIVSFPTIVCALGALAFGVVVDRVGDVRLLMIGMALVILGDVGVSLAPELNWLFAARLFQGFGYVCLTVAAPSFIHRTTSGDMRRAAMAFWAAHTPVGFAVAVYAGAQLVAAGMSWRYSFLGHAATALLVGVAVFALRRVRSEVNFSRSAGTMQVLTDLRPYTVAVGALAAGMLQVGVMTTLPALLGGQYGLTGPQSALAIVAAMTANLAGAMVIVATRVRNMPTTALPITAIIAAISGFAIITEMTQTLETTIALILLFTATIGAANSLVWSLIPAAVPSPEAAGATAGLITQGSFLGVLVGPPVFFWIRHESPVLVAGLAAALALLLLVPLIANARARLASAGAGPRLGAA